MTAPVSAVPATRQEVPRLADDYTAAAARRRLAFLTEATGVSPEHLGRYSFDPAVLAGNIENFVGVAQVPIGIAGPLLIDELARQDISGELAAARGHPGGELQPRHEAAARGRRCADHGDGGHHAARRPSVSAAPGKPVPSGTG